MLLKVTNKDKTTTNTGGITNKHTTALVL